MAFQREQRDLGKAAAGIWVEGENKVVITDFRIFFDCVALACGKNFLLSPLFNDDVRYRPCFDSMAHGRTQDNISVTLPLNCL